MVGNKVIHNQTKCKGLRVFETHILKGHLYLTIPLKAQRSMQGRRRNACKSQWRWWFQRNSIFQTQKDWRTHGLKTLSQHVQDWHRFKPDKTQQWERKSQLEPKSYVKLIILEKGKICQPPKDRPHAHNGPIQHWLPALLLFFVVTVNFYLLISIVYLFWFIFFFLRKRRREREHEVTWEGMCRRIWEYLGTGKEYD